MKMGIMEEFRKIREIDNIGSKNLILEKETYASIGAATDVHYRLGEGFLEPIHQEALTYEFGLRGIPFEEQKRLPIMYKNIGWKKDILRIFFVAIR